MKEKRLIVGLGNPGKEYARTRHNLGFRVVERLMKDARVKPVKENAFSAFHARIQLELYDVHYLLPFTYMNESGVAMKSCMQYYKIGFQSVLIVVDDVALPYGSLRVRPSGSSGGHNGLKSIQHGLGTDLYSRLKIGVGAPGQDSLKEYVLDNLTADEELKWPKVEQAAVALTNRWMGETGLTTSWVLNELI